MHTNNRCGVTCDHPLEEERKRKKQPKRNLGVDSWLKSCCCPHFIKRLLVAVARLHCSAERLQPSGGHVGVWGVGVSCRGGWTGVIRGQRNLWVRWQAPQVTVSLSRGSCQNQDSYCLRRHRSASAACSVTVGSVWTKSSVTAGSGRRAALIRAVTWYEWRLEQSEHIVVQSPGNGKRNI